MSGSPARPKAGRRTPLAGAGGRDRPTEAACAGGEAELLAMAKRAPLRVLQETARKRRLEALDLETLAARQRSARCFGHWRDELGVVARSRGAAPEAGVALVARLDAQTRRI